MSCTSATARKGGGSSGGGAADGGQVEADEEAESSSSSSSSSSPLSMSPDLSESDHLEKFRQEWKQEVAGQKVAAEGTEDGSSSDYENTAAASGKPASDEREEKALALFLEGVADEEEGRLYDAIVKYKKAINLMPDVEKKAFDLTSRKAKVRSGQSRERQESESSDKGQNEGSQKVGGLDNNGEDGIEGDLVNCFAAMTLQKNFVCQPEHHTKSTHISSLPMEVLIHIIKWVVSSDLDTRSLENFSEVCRGFYLVARSSDVWRLICLKTWGLKVMPKKKKLAVISDWRSVFLQRPRVHLNGCYISKMSYMREGERSFTDHQFYRAWHIVQYYRLIRFFPGGFVVMNTTADKPAEAVKGMTELGMSGGYSGRYQTIDNRVVCVVKKMEAPAPPPSHTYKRGRNNNKKQYVFEVPEQVLHFELEIRGKRHKQLHWLSYAMTNRWRSTGREQVSEFDVNNVNNYPPLHFSLVKSYRSLVANAPLS